MFNLPAIKKALKTQSRILIAIGVLTVLGLGLGIFLVFSNQGVAATVNGQKISKADYERRVEVQTYFYSKVSPDNDKVKSVKKDVMDFFIEMALVEQELRKYGQQVTQKEIDEAYASKAASRGGLVQYEQFIKENYQQTPEDIKLTVKFDLLKEELVSHDSKAHLYGLWFAKKSAGDKLEEDLTEAEKAANAEVRQRAEAALVRVKAGEDFAKLAEELSEDEASKTRGGDLGIYSHFSSQASFNQPSQPNTKVFPSVKVMDDALRTLGEGEAALFDYLSGYAVIKATDVQKGFDYQTIEQFFTEERKKADIVLLVKI